MKKIRQLLGTGTVAGIFLASGALAAATQTAMLTRISGEVLLGQGGGETLAPAQPFKKLQPGDRIVLKAGAQVEIVHFPPSPGGSGRSEIWRGPTTVSVHTGQGQGSDGQAPEVRDLGKASRPVALNKSGQSPMTGGFTVRGMGSGSGGGTSSPALEQVLNAYCQLRESAAAGDATPEQYLSTALTDQGYPPEPSFLAGWVEEKKAQGVAGPCLVHWQKLLKGDPAK